MFKDLRVKNVVPDSSSLSVLSGKPSLMVITILFFYLLYRTKTIADKFGTIRLKLSSTPLKTFNLRLRSKEGLELIFLVRFSFEEVSL